MAKPRAKAADKKWVAADFFSLDLPGAVLDLYQQINQRRIQVTSKPVPSRLYHYTNTGGLLGIVEKNKLWATHIAYLNDASELAYARTLVDAGLSEYEKTAHPAYVREFARRAREMFDVTKTMDVFVSCFCENGDLLSQWRGYAQAGEGYSIGVDGDLLGRIGGGLNFFFGNVVYDRALQEETLGLIVHGCVDGVRRLTASLPEGKASAILDQFCHVLRRLLWYSLVTFKDATFAEEKEWRAITIMNRTETAKRIHFRSSANKLAPYIEIDFSSLEPVRPYALESKIPIRELLHGPTLNPELSVQALQMLLVKHGYADAEIKGSRIPLRL